VTAPFGDLALELGALALALGNAESHSGGAEPHSGGAEPQSTEVVEFLVLASTPEALWRKCVESTRPARCGAPAVVLRARLGLLRSRAASDPVAALLCAAHDHATAPRAPLVFMGIVNITPDSFSDGGLFEDPARAVEHGLALVADGAEILDIGGESTRPGALPVEAKEELRRVLPVIASLAAVLPKGVSLSIDTSKAEVARAAVRAGATIVNDVSAGEADPAMLATVAELEVKVILMHRQGRPGDMQVAPRYEEPLLDVARYLRRRVRAGLDSGIAPHRIWLDPGIGFGKRLPHNLALLARARELRSLGLPLLVGPSRKSFIGHVLGAERPFGAEKLEGWAEAQRDTGSPTRRSLTPGSLATGSTRSIGSSGPTTRVGGTAAAVATLAAAAVDVLRVHDVRTMVEAAKVAEALASVTRP